jgi:hypothetical protein
MIERGHKIDKRRLQHLLLDGWLSDNDLGVVLERAATDGDLDMLKILIYKTLWHACLFDRISMDHKNAAERIASSFASSKNHRNFLLMLSSKDARPLDE